MKISDVLRGLIDVVDNHSDESPVVAGQEENTSFTGSLKPVTLPDVKSQVRVEKGETTPAGNAEQPEELFLPPLQMKMELLKKAVEVENVYDDGTPEQQEESRQEEDGPWTGPEHHYEYVGAQTGVVEGGSKDTSDKEETMSESIRNTLDKMNHILESCDDDYQLDEAGYHDADFVNKTERLERLRALAKRQGDREKFDLYNDELKKLYGSDHYTPGGDWDNKKAFESQLDERGEPADEQAVRELVLFADNDGNLYRQSYEPIIKNLQKKVAKGVYDPEMAIKLWKYHADRAAQSYAKQHGDGTPWNVMFNPATRMEAAKQFEDQAREEIGADQLNELSPQTLKDYIKKASGDADKSWGLANAAAQRSNKGRKSDMDQFMKHSERFGKRKAGIDRALDQLDEMCDDECQLDELSKKTLKSYLKKAGEDYMKVGDDQLAHYNKHGSLSPEIQNREFKRSMGIDRAEDRLGIAEEQLDEGRIDPVEAYEILDELGLLGRDFFELSNDEVSALMDQAKRLGYKSDRRTAPGSPARMFFQYLTRMADGVAKRRAARGMEEDCGMARMKELAGLGEGHADFDDEDFSDTSTSYDLGFDDDEDYEPEQDDISDLGFQADEELWEDKELKRIKELAVANKGINPVILDALTDDLPE